MWATPSCLAISGRFSGVLLFAEAKGMEKRSSLFVSFEIFGQVSGEKNVSGVAAVHHPLRHIKTGPGKVGLTVHIDHAADRAAVYSHPKLSVFFESATD